MAQPFERILRRQLLQVVVLGLALGGVAWTTSAAQVPGKKPPIEEEEDPVKKPPKVVPIDENPKAKPAPKQVIAEAVDLPTASREAKNLEIRKLFRALMEPHDVIRYRSGHENNIQPLRIFIGKDPSRLKSNLRIVPFLQDWSPGRPNEIAINAIEEVQPYEQVAQELVKQFLNKPLDENPKATSYISRQDMLFAGEKALTAVLRYHESAASVKNGVREGEDWTRVETELREFVRSNIHFKRVDLLIADRAWEDLVRLVEGLAANYKDSDRNALADHLARVLGKVLQTSNYDEDKLREITPHLRRLEELLPSSQAAKPIHDQLQKQAQQLFDQAKVLVEQKQPQEALAKLRRAEQLWPRLPGLRDYLLIREEAYPVLRVGVRDLPTYMLPGMACTDSEKQACELLFESLVKPANDPKNGQSYLPCLCASRPRLSPLGREFLIPREAYWSNNQRITAADVCETVRYLKNPAARGCIPAWSDLIDAQMGSDPQHVTLTLRQGFLDPLALMSFKILPQTVTTENQLKFATEPVGSGPFQYAGRQQTEAGRTYCKFLANPNYGSRAGRLGMPWIREIHFFVTEDPSADLEKGRLDLCVDVPTDKLAALSKIPGISVLPPAPMRRVYFLAVNHANIYLQDEHLRRAISQAINRDEILAKFFQGTDGKTHHKSLAGPYPADSWAYDASVPRSLFSENGAKASSAAALKLQKTQEIQLSLKYPSGDARLRKAMEHIHDKLLPLGINLKLEALEAHELRDAVEMTHAYELAYYQYDYNSDAYWLWPLFDTSPQALGTDRRERASNYVTNYLGYQNDAVLQSLFGKAMSYRDFREVQRNMRDIADLLQQRLPLIPLWQLERHIAMRDNVKPAAAPDPLLLFNNVENWKMKK